MPVEILMLVLALSAPDTEIVHCKYKSRAMDNGCGTVHYNLCTDGETQWEEDKIITSLDCDEAPIHTMPIDPDEWQQNKETQEWLDNELEIVH
jgi:hypothetical protein